MQSRDVHHGQVMCSFHISCRVVSGDPSELLLCSHGSQFPWFDDIMLMSKIIECALASGCGYITQSKKSTSWMSLNLKDRLQLRKIIKQTKLNVK